MSNLQQRFDKLVINLRVLSKISPYQKLMIRSQSLSIRNHYWFLTPLIRTIAGESREDTICGLKQLHSSIEHMINELVTPCMYVINGQHQCDRKHLHETIANLTSIKILLPGIYEESNLGLLALRETYLDDPETTSQLDELILGFQKTGRRIETEIENLMSKLSEHL